jgi:hypothetical protein
MLIVLILTATRHRATEIKTTRITALHILRIPVERVGNKKLDLKLKLK